MNPTANNKHTFKEGNFKLHFLIPGNKMVFWANCSQTSGVKLETSKHWVLRIVLAKIQNPQFLDENSHFCAFMRQL